jgi:hypothetical protein
MLTLKTYFMRNLFLLLLTVIIIGLVFADSGCKKSSPSPPPEENLKISIDAASFTITPGPDFNFNVSVESVMPAGGVQIIYNVVGESDRQDYPQGQGIFTSGKMTRINISNLPRQKICICTVNVNSMSKITNTAELSFKVAYK